MFCLAAFDQQSQSTHQHQQQPNFNDQRLFPSPKFTQHDATHHQQQHQRWRFIPPLSRATAPDGWAGSLQTVTHVHLEHSTGLAVMMALR